MLVLGERFLCISCEMSYNPWHRMSMIEEMSVPLPMIPVHVIHVRAPVNKNVTFYVQTMARLLVFFLHERNNNKCSFVFRLAIGRVMTPGLQLFFFYLIAIRFKLIEFIFTFTELINCPVFIGHCCCLIGISIEINRHSVFFSIVTRKHLGGEKTAVSSLEI